MMLRIRRFLANALLALLLLGCLPSSLMAGQGLEANQTVAFFGGRLHLPVPDGWRIQVENGDSAARLVRGIGTYHGFILLGSVATEGTFLGEDLLIVRDGVLEGLRTSLEGFQLTSSQGFTLSGHPAFRLRYTYIYDGIPFQAELVTVSAMEGLHSLNLAAPVETYTTARPALEQLLDSLRTETGEQVSSNR